MPHLKVNRKLEPAIVKPKPIKVIIGGRGSGKSIGVGDIMTMKMDTEGADVYCLREYQDTVADSVHRVFVDSVEKRLGLKGWQLFENKVVSPNGAKTVYKGANRNPDSMQSAQGFKYSWFEEAHRASKSSLDKLLPTIIRNPGAECWFTANPQSSGDPFSKRFIVPYLAELERSGYYEDDVHMIIIVNWRDNPWWNDEQEKLRAWDFEHRPRSEYDWIWEGKFNDTIDSAIIQPEWFDACIDAHKVIGFKPRGARIAAHDPADSGDARTYGIRHGVVVTDLQENTEDDVNDSCDWACDLASEASADHFVWDADGMGLSLKRQVKKSFSKTKTHIHMFHGGSGVYDPDKIYQSVGEKSEKTNHEMFKNLRAQCYWDVRDRCYKTWQVVNRKAFYDPDELISFSSDIGCMQKLRSELCRIPRKYNGTGVIQLYTKKEMKDKFELDSPNLADNVMMMFNKIEEPTKKTKRPLKLKTKGIV